MAMQEDQINGSETLPRDRSAGVCLHLTSLPGPFGIGELGDSALAFVDSMVRMNLKVWQFLPTGPTAYGDSPYQPLSTFAGNELLIGTTELIRDGLLRSNEADALLHLPAASVDYGRLIPAKKALLGRAANRFDSLANSAQKSRYDTFLDNNDAAWLHDYALYRILKTRHDERPWTQWEVPFVQRDEKALTQIEHEFARDIKATKISQFLFDDHWKKLRNYAAEHGVVLFGDMPICIALDSSDAWANRDIVCLDERGQPTHVAGVPPDYFSEDGQLWGNPLYDWENHAANGYSWWIDRLRKSADLADLVRIDHFRGFEAYWSIPSDAPTARFGEWVPGPGDAIFRAMGEAIGHLPIVAEDLGVITPEVEQLRDRYRIPGMRVLQFEVSYDDFDMSDICDNSVCYTGTHDNDTTVGWFRGSPNDIRSPEEIERTRKAALEMTNGHPDTIHNDLIRLACSSASRLAIAPMQDYLGLNTPGTSCNNWRGRLEDHELTPALIDSVAEMVSTSDRRGPK